MSYEMCKSLFPNGRECGSMYYYRVEVIGKDAILHSVKYGTNEWKKEIFDAEKIRNEIEEDRRKRKEEAERAEYERKDKLGLLNLYCPVCKSNSVNIRKDQYDDSWGGDYYDYYMRCSCGIRSDYFNNEIEARDWWNEMIKKVKEGK